MIHQVIPLCGVLWFHTPNYILGHLPLFFSPLFCPFHSKCPAAMSLEGMRKTIETQCQQILTCAISFCGTLMSYLFFLSYTGHNRETIMSFSGICVLLDHMVNTEPKCNNKYKQMVFVEAFHWG